LYGEEYFLRVFNSSVSLRQTSKREVHRYPLVFKAFSEREEEEEGWVLFEASTRIPTDHMKTFRGFLFVLTL